jgi:hypothetical protein
MSEHQDRTTSEKQVYEPCLCREFLNLFRVRLDVSSEVQQHLRNSRIELLKAIRQAIDERIHHVSNSGKQGTTVPVE